MCVIVVVTRVDVTPSIITKLGKCLCMIISVNSDLIAARPDFHADQHDVDVFWMIQL